MGKSVQAGRDDRPEPPSTARDANDSFVKKMTSRVSELIPNTLSRWFGSQRPLVRRRESSSSSNDDDDEEPADRRPPTKRPCLPTDRNRYVDSSGYGLSNGLIGERSKPEPFVKYEDVAESRFLKLYERSSDGPVDTGAKTSALQAELERTARKAVSGYDGSDGRANGTEKSESEDSTSGCSSMAQRNRPDRCEDPFGRRRPTRYDASPNVSERSLFTKLDLRLDSSPSPRRPSFDVSSFGSPSLVDRTLTSERITNSPFYKGATRFGGASAALRRTPSVRQNPKPRIAVEVRPAKETVELSKTARRILDALEHVSSPIEDVRNMPCPNITRDRSRTGRTPYSRPSSTKPLVVPTVCDLLRMKRVDKLRESTETVRNIAARTDPVVDETRNVPEYKLRSDDAAAPQRSNKIRPKISKTRGVRDGTNEYSERVELPEVSLKIVNMPKFDIPMPAPTRPAARYVFAAPSEVAGTVEHGASDRFEFSSPIYPDERPAKPATARTLSPVLKRKPLSSVKSHESAERNSVADVSVKRDEKTAGGETTWVCETCMIGNRRPDATRCVACKTVRSGAPATQERQFEDWFASQADKWKCGVCLVRNSTADTACVACTAERPGAKPEIAPEKKVPDGARPAVVGFGDAFKPPADTWSCDVCLIRNKSGADLCAACDSPRPGSKKPCVEKKPIEWECPTCAVRNADSSHECVCCRTMKPGSKPVVAIPGGAPPIGTFKFGIDRADVGAKEAAPPVGFVFGKTDAATAVTTAAFTFGIPTSPEKKDTGAAGQFAFGIPAPDKAEAQFTFGIPAPKNDDDEKVKSVDEEAKTVDVVKKSVEVETPVPKNPTKIPAHGQSTFKTDPPVESTASSTVFPSTTSVKSDKDTSVCDGKSTDVKEQSPENVKSGFEPTIGTKPETAVEKSETKPAQNHLVFERPSAKPVGGEPKPILFGSAFIPTQTHGFGEKPSFETDPEKKNPFGQPKSAAAVEPRAFQTPADAKPAFGSSMPEAPSFGAPRPAGSLFGATEAAKPSTNGYAFDASSSTESKPPPPPFTFGAADGSKPAKVQKFPFAAGPAGATTPFSFGGDAPAVESKSFAFTFGGDKTDRPSFGNVTAAPLFGSSGRPPPPPFGSAVAPANDESFGVFGANNKSPMFNFGSAAPQTPAKIFPFGSTASSSGTPFTFGAQSSAPPSFDPNSKPMFNFSGSSAPTAFTAQSAAGTTPAVAQRKVRRAIRRTQR